MDTETCEDLGGSDTIIFTRFRTSRHTAGDSHDEAEMLRAYRSLSPADREHVLKLSLRLAAWHG
jgi:hypothetical protein